MVLPITLTCTVTSCASERCSPLCNGYTCLCRLFLLQTYRPAEHLPSILPCHPFPPCFCTALSKQATMQQRVADCCMQRSQPLDFYDIWVARDIDGHLLLKQPPYVTDPYSLERVALGLPFPVKCCWNGVVAMTAAPFTRHNLRMRCVALTSARLLSKLDACICIEYVEERDQVLGWQPACCCCTISCPKI